MTEQIYSGALTTVARVKNRLSITSSGWDSVLLRLINAATDFLQSQCDRTFLSTSYTEVQQVNVNNAQYIFLKQAPVTVLTSVEYRVGLYDSPNWTTIPTTDYELVEDGEQGIIRVHGYLWKGIDTVRIKYTAGYLIDFANFGTATHTLPADLTELCEKLVVRWFKRREAEGKTEEVMGSQSGGTIKWQQGLNMEDKSIISAYKKMPRFF